METFSINADVRAKEERISTLKQENVLAGVVYGAHQEPISLKMDYPEFLKTFRKSGESQIINLTVGKKSLDVLVHDIQRNPVTGDYTHVDFYAVTKGEKLTTHIAIHFVGTAPAVKNSCLINEVLKEIEVKCLPKDLTDSFEVDLSSLKDEGDSIKVEDLKLGDKYELVHNHLEDVIAIASKTKEEVIEDTAPEAELPESEKGSDAPAEEEEKEEK